MTAPPFSHFQLLFILVPLSSSHDVSAGVFFVSCSFCSVGLVNVSLLSSVQLFCDPEDCSQPGSSVHRIYQQEYWSELPFPPPGIFLTQGLNVSLLHCRQILNCWAIREAPLTFFSDSFLISCQLWGPPGVNPRPLVCCLHTELLFIFTFQINTLITIISKSTFPGSTF